MSTWSRAVQTSLFHAVVGLFYAAPRLLYELRVDAARRARAGGVTRKGGRLAVLIAAAGLIALTAVGNGRTASPSSPTIAVETQDNTFAPEVLRVAPGSTIVWHNLGRNAHSVTADDRAWNSGLVDPGRTFRRTFSRPGTYRYFCVPHGGRDGRGMAGVILVGDAPLPAGPRPAPVAGTPAR